MGGVGILPTIAENQVSPEPGHFITSQSLATKCRSVFSHAQLLHMHSLRISAQKRVREDGVSKLCSYSRVANSITSSHG